MHLSALWKCPAALLILPFCQLVCSGDIVPHPPADDVVTCFAKFRACNDPVINNVLNTLQQSSSIRQRIVGTGLRAGLNKTPDTPYTFPCDPLWGSLITALYPGTVCDPFRKQNSSIVFWSPNDRGAEDKCLAGTSESSPCEVLLHELKHAYNHQMGTFNPSKVVCNGKPVLKAEETDAVDFANRFRRCQGLKERCCYSGCALDFPCCSNEAASQSANDIAAPAEQNNMVIDRDFVETGAEACTARPADRSAAKVLRESAESCPVCPPERLATNGMCAPAVLFKVETRLHRDNNDKIAAFSGGAFNWTGSTELKTGFAYLHLQGADGHARGDFDIKYAGADGTVNLTAEVRLSPWIAGGTGRSFTFRQNHTWTLSPYTYYATGGRTFRTSGSSSFQQTIKIGGGCTSLPEYPGVCFRRWFVNEAWASFDRLGHPEFNNSKMKAHFEVSIEFLP